MHKNKDYSNVFVIDGQRIRVTVRRNEKTRRPPLLICNGLGVNLEILEPLASALDEFAIIRFDAPGTGGSSTPLAPYRIGCLAELLDTLVERLGYPEVDVLGISWGGAVAQEFALNHSMRCRRLILAATSPGFLSVPGNPLAMALAMSPGHWIGSHLIGRDAGLVFGGDFRRKNGRAPRRMHGFKPPNLLGFYWQLLAVWGWTSLHRLASIEQPTLLLAGEDDPLVPLANARIMQRLIPDARLETFDCGHLFPLTRAALVAGIIDEFTSASRPRGDEQQHIERGTNHADPTRTGS